MQDRDNQKIECPIHRSQSPIPNAQTANRGAATITAAAIQDVPPTRDASRLQAAAPMTKKEKQDLQLLQILFLKD